MTSAAVEREILEQLEGLLALATVQASIEPIVERVAQKLARDASALMAWEPVPLTVYEGRLPEIIRSSWVFILRAGATTELVWHPNSHERITTYRGFGDLQVWAYDAWRSHRLGSDPHGPVESRWVSIQAGTWHKAVVPEQDWVVVSFHTAPEDELIEERDDPNDIDGTLQRKYV